MSLDGRLGLRSHTTRDIRGTAPAAACCQRSESVLAPRSTFRRATEFESCGPMAWRGALSFSGLCCWATRNLQLSRNKKTQRSTNLQKSQKPGHTARPRAKAMREPNSRLLPPHQICRKQSRIAQRLPKVAQKDATWPFAIAFAPTRVCPRGKLALPRPLGPLIHTSTDLHAKGSTAVNNVHRNCRLFPVAEME